LAINGAENSEIFAQKTPCLETVFSRWPSAPLNLVTIVS
jgi:hypothetical protein